MVFANAEANIKEHLKKLKRGFLRGARIRRE